MESTPEQIKSFYRSRSETNWVKRYQSPYILRRYFCRTMWAVTALPVKNAPLVLDAGCGDGVLSVLLALWHPHQKIIAMDISKDAVCATREAAKAHGIVDRMVFVVGDAEHLPFKNGVLPAILSCQVLEHLPDFDQGVREIGRVLMPDGIGVIAIPTCLNPSAMALLGRDSYWRVSKRTAFALWWGMIKVLWAWLKGEEGVNEGYAGHSEVPHVRRFPWKAVRRIEQNGLKVIRWMADSLLMPYLACLFPSLIRLQQWMDERLRAKHFWRNLGVGVVLVVKRKS